MKIKKYKLQKVLVEEVDFRLPETILYLFEYHIKRSLKVIPIYTTFQKEFHNKPEELYQIAFVEVLDAFNHIPTIKKTVINISDLESIYSKNDFNDEKYKLLDFLNTYTEVNVRTPNQFDSDFAEVLRNIKNV